MNFDFALWLVIITLVTGVLWLADTLFVAPKRKARIKEAQSRAEGELPESAKEELSRLPMWADISKSMFPVLAVVLVLRSFLFEPFEIPSGSMLPTLKIGDYILVNKFDYGLRLPVVNQKIVPIGEPQRGDVVVFKYPKDPSVNYIKRLIGLPGDTITYKDKVLYVNGVKQEQTLEARIPPLQPEKLLVNEKLGELNHDIYRMVDRPTLNGTWVVPENAYFMMGDNRDNSNDSRYWGFVPDNLLVGKAVAVWMHWPSFGSLPDFSHIRAIH